ncbi:MAG: YihY/virulence factor BrkB family protein [Oscillospiraceae bacterium]|nr:YihY/virulence factor BrkB family protein [Oscillospiraceae bacterium]
MLGKRQILRQGWDHLRQMSSRFTEDHLSAYAAQTTFYLLLAFFPFIMLIVLATRLLPITEETLITAIRVILPENYQSIGIDLVDGYYKDDIGSAKIVLIVFLVWTASRLIQALMNGFNSVYHIQENRSQAVLRLIGCAYTVVLSAMMVALIVMYALGTKAVGFLLSKLPEHEMLDSLVSLIRNLASPTLLFLVFWIAYAILPNRKTKLRYEIPGALAAAAFWRLMAFAYDAFLDRSEARYLSVYHGLSGVVMLLVWLYVCVYVWFLGGELNCYLQKRRREGRGIILNPVRLWKRLFHREKA